ncbi:MAG: hypothetical protein II866_06245 [Prevotella sp.]|nr:hypothetical protein [Prevotella sp.]
MNKINIEQTIMQFFTALAATGLCGAARRMTMTLILAMLTATTAWATTPSAITVGGTDYTLYTGFTATAGTKTYANFVDGNTSTKWQVMKKLGENARDFAGGTEDPAYVEFHADAPIIPKGYVLTYDNSVNENWKPTSWALKAKLNESDDWTAIHSSNSSLGSGSRFEIACNNDGDNMYQYFRFEIYDVGSTYQSILNELEFYGSSPDVYYTHLTVKAATCTETGIKQDCYQRNDGKYFTDETGTTELAESAVIDPMIPHTCVHHEATDVNIEYWQCSMCSKYFSDEGYTTEITEEQTKIYRTITIDDGISSLVTSSVDKALAGATVTLTVSHLIDTSTLQVNSGSVTLADAGNGTYTFTVPAADVTVTASILSTYSITLPANMTIVSATNAADSNGKYISGTVIKFAASFGYAATNVSDGTNTLEPDADGIYTVTVAEADINITATTESSNTLYLATANSDFTAADGNILIGTTSHTVTIANNAKITLNNATITGGIVCDETAEITLVGENAVGVTSLDGTLIYQTAGIQIGSSGTTLTIKGNGSLNATGGSASAGIGLGRTWDANATGGSIVIEGGTVTASGGNGIGTGTVGNEKTATIGDIVIKGGTVNARLGKGTINYGCTATIGAIKIYDTIDKVDASAITESVTYMHVENETETDVTASASTYFTIIEDGDRRTITLKDDTDYTITIVGNTEHGTIACTAATAKYGDKVTITATPDFGYRLSRLVVKDAQNNDVESTGNSFFMPKGNVTVSAVFEQGTHGTTEFAWGYFGPSGFVREASIYDGLTTVNLQQGQSYQILKYDESSYRKFLLDNDTYNATIPYSGGTGTFTYGNGTNFNINSGESGFYDITMTDVGNGKWSVSILKTVVKMDDIPDQTYTGSEITPEPLVLAGSLSLTKGTDYEYSYTNNTNVGTAKVTVTFKGDYASLGSVEKEFNITKATPTVTAPTAIADLIYTGSAQALVTGGTTDVGDILSYCLEENGMYSADIPTGTNAGTYTVYYKVDGSDNWNAVAGGTVEVPISPKAVTVTAEAKSKEYGAADPDLTATVEGLVGEDAISYTVSRTAGEAVGEYTITPTGEAAQGNYTVSFVAGTLAITAKTVTDNNALKVTQDQNGYHATFTGSANDAVSITEPITVNSVSLNRDFTANQPATVMLPFSLGDGQTVSGGSFYKFSGVTKNGDEWKAQFTEVATLKANTPYLFMPSATGQMAFNLNGGTVTLNTTTTGEAGSTASNWEFCGTYAKVQWDGSASDPSDLSKTYGFAKGNATIAAGQFVHFAAGAWLKPMRCYLVYNGSTEGGTFQNAPSRTRGAGSTEELPQTITVVLLSSSGETTAIGTLDTKTGDITLDGWYTMDGRKLEGKPTKKGLYINNGRKIVIK